MSDVELFLLAVDRDEQEANEIAQQTAQRLESKAFKLLELVQSLGEYLTDDDNTVRAKAVSYLSAVLAALAKNFLTKQQTEVICQFLCDRIEDGSGFEAAVKGFISLKQQVRFNDTLAVQSMRALFKHSQDLRKHPQRTRFLVYQYLDQLMTAHRQALNDMGDESLVGICDLVAGEKDPRNLMIVFSLIKVVMVEWNILNHIELLFEAAFCYFPITFRPPPDDPYHITAQDLKERLRECIASNKYFAPFAFPALIDKLDSQSPNVKKDVLQTFTACAASYDPTTISKYSVTLWDTLKYEILSPQEDDLAEEALHSLRAIAEKLSFGLSAPSSGSALEKFLKPITKECNEHLEEPLQRQAKASGQILGTVGIATPVSFSFVIQTCMGPLLNGYKDAGSLTKQRALLEVVVQLLDSDLTLFGSWISRDTAPLLTNPLDSIKDQLFTLFSQALMSTGKEEVSFRKVALQGLLRLAQTRHLLAENEIGMVVQHLDEIVLLEEPYGRDEMKTEAIHALVEISKGKPSTIGDIAFPAFLAKLPEQDQQGQTEYYTILRGLAELGVEKALFDTLLRRLLNKLDIVVQNGSTPNYACAIISAFIYVLSKRDLKTDPNLPSFYEKFVVGLTRKAVSPLVSQATTTTLNDDRVLQTLGSLITLIVRALNEQKQTEVAQEIYSLYVDPQQPGLNAALVLFAGEVPEEKRRTLILSTALLAGLQRNIALPYIPTILLPELIHNLARRESNPTIRLSILRQIGLLLNKHTSQIAGEISGILSHLAANLPSIEDPIQRQNKLRALFWATKALVLRTDPSATELLHTMLSFLADETNGLSTARGFSILLAPDEVLAKDNNAQIRLLHKQRLFNYCVPQIAERFRNTDKGVKANYLIALAGILKWVPGNVVMDSLNTLVPLLLQSLDLEGEDQVQIATIGTLRVIVEGNAGAVESHVSSLVSRLLKSASVVQKNPAEVRSAALNCLRIFPATFRPEKLIPLRTQVTRKLQQVLDDPKRNVRKEAVDCRAAWFTLDEPDEDE